MGEAKILKDKFDAEQKEYDENKLKAEVYTEARKKYGEVMDQREEIMTAFVAKYQCQPDEIVQVEWRKSVGELLWFLVKKSDCIYCEKCREVMAEGQPRGASE